MASSVAISAPNAVLGIPRTVWGINSGVTEATDSTCSYTGWNFARGDGVTTEFELPSLVSTMNTLYRRDWQGTVALSTSARTNYCLQSEDITSASWLKQNSGTGILPAVTGNYVISPRGDLTADRVVLDIGSGTTVSDLSQIQQTVSMASGDTCTSIWAKSNTGTIYTLTMVSPDGYFLSVKVGSAWSRIYYGKNTSSSTTSGIRLRLRGDEGTSKYVDISVFGGQVEIGTLTPTPYLGPTTTAPVTVTDYALSGSTLTLAEAPVIGADLSVDADLLPHSSLSFGGK